MPQRHNGNPPEKSIPLRDKPINRLQNVAQETAGAAQELASNALSSAGQKADHLAASLGGTLHSLASNLRTLAPGQDPLGQAASGVAEVLERTGEFLQKEGIHGLTEEANRVVRRHPWSAVCVALGIGFLLAQLRR